MFYDRLRAKAEKYAATSTPTNTLIPIGSCIAPAYKDLLQDIRAGNHSNYFLPGGRGSGKSSFVSLELIDGIMADPTGTANAMVIRKYANTLRESVYSQLQWAISALNANNLWQSTLSPLSLIYKPTGARIYFRGLDDPTKLKSIKPAKGYFKYLWIEELSEINGANTLRNVRQSIIRGSEKCISFNTFNPPQSKINWVNQYILSPDDNTLVFSTTYEMLPGEWLGQDFIDEAERLRAVNPTAYEHEYHGIPVGTGAEVFDNLDVRELSDEEINTHSDFIYCGLDFGYSQDPAAFIRLAYDRKREIIYLLDEIYQTRLSNRELANLIKEKGYDVTGVQRRLGAIGGYANYGEKQTIFCDSAEPKSISDLQFEGIRAIGAHKFPGSVRYGVSWLQHRTITIDPKRTPHALKELSEYQYIINRDGEVTNDLPDKGNHTIDAVRYALDGIINQRKYPA